MTEAFMCDVCGDLVEGKPRVVLLNFNDYGEQEKNTDYCEDCAKEKKLV